MDVLQQTHNYRIGWYDAGQTTLVLEIFDRWTWQEAYEATHFVIDILEANSQRELYVVYHYIGAGNILPKNLALEHLANLLKATLSHEVSVIFVGASPLLSTFLDLVNRTTRLPKARLQFHFVKTFEEALNVIEQLKRQQSAD